MSRKRCHNPEILSAHVGTFFHRFAGFKKGRMGSAREQPTVQILTAHVRSSTIEQILGRRKALHVSMLEHRVHEVRDALHRRLESDEAKHRLRWDSTIHSSIYVCVDHRSESPFTIFHRFEAQDVPTCRSLRRASLTFVVGLKRRMCPYTARFDHHLLLAQSIIDEAEGLVREHKEGRSDEWYNDERCYDSAVRDGMALFPMSVQKFDMWVAEKTMLAEVLSKRSIKWVTRRRMSELNRMLYTRLDSGAGKHVSFLAGVIRTPSSIMGEQTEDSDVRQIALDLCIMRGAVVRTVDEVNSAGEPPIVTAAGLDLVFHFPMTLPWFFFLVFAVLRQIRKFLWSTMGSWNFFQRLKILLNFLRQRFS